MGRKRGGKVMGGGKGVPRKLSGVQGGAGFCWTSCTTGSRRCGQRGEGQPLEGGATLHAWRRSIHWRLWCLERRVLGFQSGFLLALPAT